MAANKDELSTKLNELSKKRIEICKLRKLFYEEKRLEEDRRLLELENAMKKRLWEKNRISIHYDMLLQIVKTGSTFNADKVEKKKLEREIFKLNIQNSIEKDKLEKLRKENRQLEEESILMARKILEKAGSVEILNYYPKVEEIIGDMVAKMKAENENLMGKIK